VTDAANPRLDAARTAYENYDWAEAIAGFRALETDGIELDAADLERLGYAVMLGGDHSVEDLERAFERYERGGRNEEAVRIGVDLVRVHGGRLKMPIAMGWARRAQRLLEGQPESGAHAHLLVLQAFLASGKGDVEGGVKMVEDAHAIARRHRDVDAEALALNRRGLLLVRMGRVEEGKADLDEAMVLVRGGSMRPFLGAFTYCITIDACADMADYDRAMLWTDAAESWVAERRAFGFPGICQVHRAELLRIKGDRDGAEREVEKAIQNFERTRMLNAIGLGERERGHQLLEVGELEAAEAAFEAAEAAGFTPQPGRAVLALRRGDPASARSGLELALREKTDMVLERAKLLPAFVEACLALDDLAAARQAAEELEKAAVLFGTVGLRARASTATARVRLHEKDAVGAVVAARTATREWNAIGAAYELARSRQLLASAYTIAGDSVRAECEEFAAKQALDSIGVAAPVPPSAVATINAKIDDVMLPPQFSNDPRISEGTVIDDKIEVSGLVGAGAMGLVFAGKHRMTGRDVAIKVLQKVLCGDDHQCRRFLQEALACGRIKHQNVVDIYDAGTHGDEPYIVMELLSGEALSERLLRAPAPTTAEVLTIAEQMARGVAAAHAANVVHRDLKPDNVFLSPVNGNGLSVKVLDFGISKLPDAKHTAPGALLGTPFYMAPEQVRDATKVDPRTDIHALGAVLFEMLAGRPPYLGDGVTGVLLAIAEGPAPDLAAVRPDLPSETVALVHRALARESAARFASATEMADAIAGLAN
jgi:tetratricopeptide (TPR) repeat protein